jgi:hypothetical protein
VRKHSHICAQAFYMCLRTYIAHIYDWLRMLAHRYTSPDACALLSSIHPTLPTSTRVSVCIRDVVPSYFYFRRWFLSLTGAFLVPAVPSPSRSLSLSLSVSLSLPLSLCIPASPPHLPPPPSPLSLRSARVLPQCSLCVPPSL